MQRRNFIKTACALCGGVAVLSLAESCKKENVSFIIDLSDPSNAALTHTGGYLYQDGVIVICVSTNNYVALSKTCTHNGCQVAYNSGNSHIECPCHGGTFDTSGNVLAGPPPKALKKYTVTQNGTVLTIS